jgi:hypothetical protein
MRRLGTLVRTLIQSKVFWFYHRFLGGFIQEPDLHASPSFPAAWPGTVPLLRERQCAGWPLLHGCSVLVQHPFLVPWLPWASRGCGTASLQEAPVGD